MLDLGRIPAHSRPVFGLVSLFKIKEMALEDDGRGHTVQVSLAEFKNVPAALWGCQATESSMNPPRICVGRFHNFSMLHKPSSKWKLAARMSVGLLVRRCSVLS